MVVAVCCEGKDKMRLDGTGGVTVGGVNNLYRAKLPVSQSRQQLALKLR